MAPEKHISDKRMLQLIDKLVADGIILIKQDFYNDMGLYKQNITNIKSGTQSFTITQIAKICKKYRVNVNWVFGFEKEIYRSKK